MIKYFKLQKAILNLMWRKISQFLLFWGASPYDLSSNLIISRVSYSSKNTSYLIDSKAIKLDYVCRLTSPAVWAGI